VVHFGASIPIDHDLETIRQWTSERLQRRSTECRLLFVGVDWARKGGAIAVETARLLNEMGVNTKLTVVGCQPEGVVPEYVEVLGFVNKGSSEGRQQLKELYRRASFFILPTRAEAAGIVFCEASAFGLPVLTFRTGGVEDYVRDGINGVCLPNGSRPTEFAATAMGLLKDSDQYSALCLGAFNEHKSRLNWDNTAAALAKLCQEAVQLR
jgi:glycosyltransferase involved in cell wall biosynthesis